MNKNQLMTLFVILFAFLSMVFLLWGLSNSNKGREYIPFAQCLTEKRVIMYGTFWCSHCSEQKRMFGNSFSYVNYIECDPRNSKGQPELCLEEGIQIYPSWKINNTLHKGTLSFERLSNLTGCLIFEETYFNEGVLQDE